MPISYPIGILSPVVTYIFSIQKRSQSIVDPVATWNELLASNSEKAYIYKKINNEDPVKYQICFVFELRSVE